MWHHWTMAEKHAPHRMSQSNQICECLDVEDTSRSLTDSINFLRYRRRQRARQERRENEIFFLFTIYFDLDFSFSFLMSHLDLHVNKRKTKRIIPSRLIPSTTTREPLARLCTSSPVCAYSLSLESTTVDQTRVLQTRRSFFHLWFLFLFSSFPCYMSMSSSTRADLRALDPTVAFVRDRNCPPPVTLQLGNDHFQKIFLISLTCLIPVRFFTPSIVNFTRRGRCVIYYSILWCDRSGGIVRKTRNESDWWPFSLFTHCKTE